MTIEAATRPNPPIWLMGLANSTIGVSGGILLLTIPQLLAGDHVPEPRIAEITGFALIPGFTAFLAARRSSMCASAAAPMPFCWRS